MTFPLPPMRWQIWCIEEEENNVLAPTLLLLFNVEYQKKYKHIYLYIYLWTYFMYTVHSPDINSYINYLFVCCCARNSRSPCIHLLQELGNGSIFYIGCTHTHVHACIYNSRYPTSVFISLSPPFFFFALVFLSCWPNIRPSQESSLSIQPQISADLTASALRRSGFGDICLNVCVLWEKHGVKGLGKGGGLQVH